MNLEDIIYCKRFVAVSSNTVTDCPSCLLFWRSDFGRAFPPEDANVSTHLPSNDQGKRLKLHDSLIQHTLVGVFFRLLRPELLRFFKVSLSMQKHKNALDQAVARCVKSVRFSRCFARRLLIRTSH